MNQLWKDFLLSKQASFKGEYRIVFPTQQSEQASCLYPIAHLSVLSVAGKDAATLLQGQITCNVNDISEHKASFGAMCNAKGRVITTFLLLKKEQGFLLILPTVLLELVKKRLQMYVLRSVVTLTDCSDTLCLLGLSTAGELQGKQFEVNVQDVIAINLSSVTNRQLIVAEPEQAIAVYARYLGQGFQPTNSDSWCYLDIMLGIPWLAPESSEEFIPQMLNLDKLSGISFNKGCYTGQEVVARTHYLGKNKRAMFVAECNLAIAPAINTPIFDDNLDTNQIVGHVLTAQYYQGNCKILVVLQLSDTHNYKLRLENHTTLTLLTFMA
jgi:tRNA-modifying protein YgfZ